MRIAALALVFPATLGTIAHADTIKAGGNIIDETWTAASGPYIVQGDLTIPVGSTLTIQAGTIVRFPQGDNLAGGFNPNFSELVVRGTLIIDGTVDQPVQLVGQTPTSRWYGIVIDTQATGTAVTASHVIMTNPVYGFRHRSASVTVATRAITISNVSDSGVRIEDGAPTYDGIVTSGGLVGFDVTGSASATLTNCAARGTTTSGVRFNSTASNRGLTLVNCTFDANGVFGVHSNAASGGSVTITNSIITGSNIGCFRQDASTWSVTYSDVWNNTQNIDPSMVGTGTISADPKYVSATDLRLKSTSPVIDTGTSSGAPDHDQHGASRPVDGDGLNAAEYDMGAYEYGTTPVCGNGATEGSESCDDANDVDTDDCRNGCVLATCGDGVIRSGAETCDDGNTVDDDGCTASCQVATCGDGIVRAGVENCDDGNTSEGDGCSAACTHENAQPGSDAGTDPGTSEDGGCCSSSRGGVTGLLGALALAMISRRRKQDRRRH